MHQAPWTQWLTTSLPSKSGKMINSSHQASRQVNRVREQGPSLLLGSNHVVILQCRVIQAHLGYLSTKGKPKAIGTLAASFSC